MPCEGVEIVMIWDPFERFLWGIGITIAFVCGIYFIRIAKKREVFNERIIMLGLASLPIGFAFSLFFTYFQVLQVPGFFSNDTICGNYESYSWIYEVLGRLSYISLGIGGMFFVLAFDIIIKRTKYSLTMIFIIITIILIGTFFVDYNYARIVFNFPLILALVIFVPLILYRYTKRSQLEFKAVSSFLLFGFILYMISLILSGRAHKKLDFYPLMLSPLLFILGCIIILLPIIIKPKVISRALTYWVLFAILTFPILIFMIIIGILKGLRYDFERWLFFIIEFFFAFFYILILFLLIIKDIRSEIISVRQKARKVDDDFKADFLAMFTRPQQVSFLASMSHELRNPLTSIIGFTRTILKRRVGEINEEQEKQLNIILNSATHLDELINRVFDITKIEANKLPIKKDKFNLVEEIINLKETFSFAAGEKGLELFVDTPENLIIYNDKQRIIQILINLIGNAVKFTDSGRIFIKIKRKKENIVISVKDTGPGIKQEDLKKLFKPFSRILEPGKYKEGSGLGLHLSKKLANLLGGDITVKSKLGKGSTFKLVLMIEEEISS
ncbi:MAG: sensor histidine kinase [Candidatus Thorarchaeota archaeon]